ncbi:hypothetical protein F4820DRAFT_33573 [Hypoxylon rubiginosum]|uniref:Uncharacterized protein n=1 Tax=Hypoxylon rubiginosum TaxID=110542 RepID=A0ACB9YS30_9PEZI|nr:hypothetical protein F4820DRAFT_33573 [Hypoxylon rubiginosum]
MFNPTPLPEVDDDFVSCIQSTRYNTANAVGYVPRAKQAEIGIHTYIPLPRYIVEIGGKGRSLIINRHPCVYDTTMYSTFHRRNKGTVTVSTQNNVCNSSTADCATIEVSPTRHISADEISRCDRPWVVVRCRDKRIIIAHPQADNSSGKKPFNSLGQHMFLYVRFILVGIFIAHIHKVCIIYVLIIMVFSIPLPSSTYNSKNKIIQINPATETKPNQTKPPLVGEISFFN